MQTDAALRCFKAGAPIGDLADALAIDRALLEQMIREALSGPLSAGSLDEPLVPSLPADPPSTTNAGKKPHAVPSRARPSVRTQQGTEHREQLLVLLGSSGGQAASDLARRAGVRVETTWYHLNKLLTLGKVRRTGRLWSVL